MSTQPPDHPSSSATSNEIEEVEQDTNNPTQINNNNNSREIDNPKEKRHKNSKKPKSIDTATNMDPRSNDSDNNKSNSEAKAEAEAKAKAEAEAEAEAEALHKLIGADLSSIKNASERINKYEEPIKLVSDRFKKFEQKRGSADEYRELKKVVKKLKQQISSKHKDDDSDAARKLWSIDSTNITGADADKLLEEMPNLYKNEAFEKSLDFKEFKERYDELDLELKLCLLSFSVFPENVEIKKRVMLYWWIGEGFVPPVPRKDTVANTASNTVPNTVANAAANTVPNALANTVANTAPNTLPNTVANAAVNTVPNALANTASNTVLNTAANTASNTVLNTAANAAANTVPNALANTVANTASNTVPNTVANTAPNTVPNTVANAAANTVPNALANTVANTAPNTVPNTVANAAVNTVPNALANTVANTASNTVLNTAANTAANTVPNALANTVANTASNTVPNTVANAAANTAPNTVPNTVANAAANTVPNALANAVANTASNTVPNTVANTAPNTVPNTVANAAANTVPNVVAPNTVSNTAAQETNDKKTPEQFANEFFKKLIEKGFIQPVYKKRSVGVDICKMHPFVRSMVVKLAKKAKFFNFDDEGNATEDYSGSLRACLKGKGLKNFEELDKLHTLFNVNEAILDFKPEWFSKMKNLNVLYLGRWQTSPTHHIEVEDTAALKIKNANVLDGLEDIRHLRFLSLQGISRVTELPESISKLSNLMILDIRACHNLEIIPNGMGLLKNLTHLDMSECYLLDQMPKGLSLLSKLQVLSGFVVGDSESKNSCTLEDLRKLPELRKLSIHTGHDAFPVDRDLRALNQFKKLTKLTIAWGRGSVEAKKDDSRKNDIGASEQAIATTKKPGLPRALTRLPTSKQSTGTLDRENIEVSKKKEISAADQAAATSKKVRFGASEQATTKKQGLQNALTRLPNSKQSTGTPDRENIEVSKKKEISAADQAAATSKKVGFAKNMRRLSSSKTVELPNAELPPGLIKLDLQSFPGMVTPPWLRAFTLKNLKKLYIRGGKFSDLGQFKELDNEELEKDKWKVEELRLKYLTDLEMDWRELQELFPDLTYLEKVNCPKLTFFPCDESGVWMSKAMGDKQLQQMAS